VKVEALGRVVVWTVDALGSKAMGGGVYVSSKAPRSLRPMSWF